VAYPSPLTLPDAVGLRLAHDISTGVDPCSVEEQNLRRGEERLLRFVRRQLPSAAALLKLAIILGSISRSGFNGEIQCRVYCFGDAVRTPDLSLGGSLAQGARDDRAATPIKRYAKHPGLDLDEVDECFFGPPPPFWPWPPQPKGPTFFWGNPGK